MGNVSIYMGPQTEWSKWAICTGSLYGASPFTFPVQTIQFLTLCRLEPLTFISEMKQNKCSSSPRFINVFNHPIHPSSSPTMSLHNHLLLSSASLSSSLICPPVLFPHLPAHPLPSSSTASGK